MSRSFTDGRSLRRLVVSCAQLAAWLQSQEDYAEEALDIDLGNTAVNTAGGGDDDKDDE